VDLVDASLFGNSYLLNTNLRGSVSAQFQPIHSIEQ